MIEFVIVDEADLFTIEIKEEEETIGTTEMIEMIDMMTIVIAMADIETAVVVVVIVITITIEIEIDTEGEADDRLTTMMTYQDAGTAEAEAHQEAQGEI